MVEIFPPRGVGGLFQFVRLFCICDTARCRNRFVSGIKRYLIHGEVQAPTHRC